MSADGVTGSGEGPGSPVSAARPVGSRGRRPRALLIVLIVGSTALVTVGLLMLASRPRAVAPSAGGRIVIVDAAGTVRTMDADGGAERRYRLAGDPLQFPAWAPDGRRLAMVGAQDAAAALFVLDDGSSTEPAEAIPEPIYRSEDHPPFYLYWSPDGRMVTFLTTERDGLALRSAPADGSSPDGVVRRGAPMYWAWTDVDRMLIHAGGDGPDAFVGEVGLDGREARRSAIVAGGFQAPAVSSDGVRRAYVASTSEPEPEIRSTVIVVEDGRDGSVRRVAVLGPTALGWAPGDGGLAFIAPRERTPFPLGSLDLLEAASTLPRTLVDEPVVAFFWSPDGGHIAALALPSDEPREVASIRALPPDPVARPAAGDGSTLRLLIIRPDDGAIELDRPVRLSETFVRQLLPYFDQYALSHRLWAPDGSALVLPVVGEDERARITVLPRDGGRPLEIAEGEIAFWGP